MSTDAISIATLSDIASEALQASGPYGRVYDLQLQSERTERQLEDLRCQLHDQWDEMQRRARGIGPMGSAHEYVERNADYIARKQELAERQQAVSAAQSEVGGIVFLPAVDRLEEIQKRLQTLNKKAGAIGTGEITLTVTDEELLLNYKTSDEPGLGDNFRHRFAVLSGVTPKIEGFEFLASVEPMENGNVVKRIPAIRYGIRHNLDVEERDAEGNRRRSGAQEHLDQIDLSRFHHSGNRCEHERAPGHVCGRSCKTLFVVYNEQTGETAQVGRTCLKDFTGMNNPEKVVKALEQVWEFMRSMGDSRGQISVIETDAFLTHVATMMRATGGYEKGMGQDAANNFYNMVEKRTDKQGQKLWIDPISPDENLAKVVKHWVTSEWSEAGPYPESVKLAIANLGVEPRHYNLLAGSFAAYNRAQGIKREQEVKAEHKHVGTVGQRETFILTLVDIKWIADRYSYSDDATKPMMIMADQDGNPVKWFASNLPYLTDTDLAPVIGGTYQVKGTVKRHEDGERYGKSTIISRCKFEKTINEPNNEEGDV